MLRRKTSYEIQLEIELANQRKINERLRRQLPTDAPSARVRIIEQALQDALKLIDLYMAGEPTTMLAVCGFIKRQRYTYAMALLKAAGVVVGGGRGGVYRWRRMVREEMIDRTQSTAKLVLDRFSLFTQNVPESVRVGVAALSPTGM